MRGLENASRSLVCCLALLLCFEARVAGAQGLELQIHSVTSDETIDHSGKIVTIPANTTLRISNGARLTLKADKIIFGPNVRIEGQGNPGAAGDAAPDRVDEWNSSGTSDMHGDWERAGSEVDRGYPGLDGKPGGRGATVEFQAQVINGRENVTYNVEGGLGGAGGEGGRGRPLRCGAPPGELKHGPQGFNGAPGPRGEHGGVIFSKQPEPEPISYALTISGGISLGSYEAGYNWALVRHIKARSPGKRQLGEPPPLNLVAITGASAGSINTFLSAMTWCQEDSIDAGETAKDNLFYSTWVPMGLEQLLPADASKYRGDDAVLSRASFKQTQNDIIAQLASKNTYRQGCIIQIGMNATRTRPELIGGGALEAPMDRFSMAMEGRAGPNGMTFHDSRQSDERPYMRPYLHLATDDSPIDPELLMKALTASSAFPVAFGLQELDYHVYGAAGPQSGKDWFWDGGLYDNLPVGLALSLVEKPLYDKPRPSGRFKLFALDPDRRRTYLAAPGGGGAPAGAGSTPRKGLGNLTQIAGNFFSVARKYELQSFIRFALPRLSKECTDTPAPGQDPHEACGGEPIVSSRFAPVFGSRLGAFGAFVLEGFREFDFGAGVYDALYSLAEQDCEWRRSITPVGARDSLFKDRCILEEIYAGFHRLRLDDPRSAETAFVVKHMLRKELRQRLGDVRKVNGLLGKVQLGAQPASNWVKPDPNAPKYLTALLQDIWRVMDLPKQENIQTELDGIRNVVAAVSQEELRSSLPPSDQAILNESGDWFATNVMRLLRRAETVERQDEFPLGKRVTTGALFTIRSGQALHRMGMDLDPSSVPDEWGLGGGFAHFLPYYAAASTRTAQVGWRPTLGLTRHVALGLPLSLSYRFPEESRFRAGAHAGLGLVARPDSLFITAVELSPRLTLNLATFDKPDVGGELAVYGLAGKVRLGLVLDRFEPINKPLDQFFVTVGIADLNGFLFHFISSDD